MIVNILLQLATLVVAVLKGVVSLTLLSKQGHAFYGTLSQFLVMATFFGSVLSLQLDAATVRFGADGRRSLGRVLFTSLACVGVVGLLLMGLMAIGGGLVSRFVFDHAGWRLPMLLAVSSSTLTALLLVAYSSLQTQSRFRRLALFQISQYVLQMLAIAVSVHWGQEVIVMAALVVVDALVLVVLLLMLWRQHGLPGFDRDYLAQALPFALPLLTSFFLTWLIHASGRFVLVNLSGISAVAPYAATFTIAALSGLLTPPFVNVLYPQVARLEAGSAAAAQVLGRTLGAYLVLSAPLVVSMVMLGETLVQLASGPGFYAGNAVMAGIALGFLFTGMTRLAGLVLLTTDKTRHMMRYLAVGAVVNVLVAYFGVPHFGVQALALGYSLGFLLPLLLVLRDVGLARLGATVASVVKGAVQLTLALIGMIAVLHWLPHQGFVGLSLAGCVGMFYYALLAYALGLIQREEVAGVVQLVKRKLNRSAQP